MVRLVVREALTSPGRLARLIERFRRGHIPLLMALVRDGFASGLFAPGLSPTLVLMAMMALGGPGQLVLGALNQRLQLPRAPAGDALADELVQVLLGGVGARGRGRRKPGGRPLPATGGRRRAGSRSKLEGQ